MGTIGVERKLPRSYSTLAECQAKAKAVFAGSRILPGRALSGTTAPENIMRIGGAANTFKIGADDSLIEGTVVEVHDTDDSHGSRAEHLSATMSEDATVSVNAAPVEPLRRAPRAKPNHKSKSDKPAPAFGRPKTLKELE
jgi:hypothetical protein